MFIIWERWYGKEAFMEETVVCGLMNELDAQWTVEERAFQVEKSENREPLVCARVLQKVMDNDQWGLKGGRQVRL